MRALARFFYIGFVGIALLVVIGRQAGGDKLHPHGVMPASAPPQPLPFDGPSLRKIDFHTVGYLQIQAPAGKGHLYFRLIDQRNGHPNLDFFLHEGHSAQVPLGAGVYLMHYARGRTWYGTQSLFGPETAFAEGHDRVNITAGRTTNFTLTFQEATADQADRRLSRDAF